jgi:hypothetical protein
MNIGVLSKAFTRGSGPQEPASARTGYIATVLRLRLQQHVVDFVLAKAKGGYHEKSGYSRFGRAMLPDISQRCLCGGPYGHVLNRGFRFGNR